MLAVCLLLCAAVVSPKSHWGDHLVVGPFRSGSICLAWLGFHIFARFGHHRPCALSFSVCVSHSSLALSFFLTRWLRSSFIHTLNTHTHSSHSHAVTQTSPDTPPHPCTLARALPHTLIHSSMRAHSRTHTHYHTQTHTTLPTSSLPSPPHLPH